jgi:tRNA pseudouridine38-40 synthase
MSSRITALWCWYHGGPFRGYQSQPSGPTVQGTLTAAMQAAGYTRGPVASGRTDLGVHARMQVVSFRVGDGQDPAETGTRLSLPGGVGVAVSREAPAGFHAQFAAVGKEYRYRLLLRDEVPGWAPYAWRVDVDPRRVAQVLELALGTRDFWAFHEKSSGRRPRTVRQVELIEHDGLAELRLVGDGFARYQVRYLVGGAVGVARGEILEADYRAGIERAVEFAGAKAPAHGLILWEVLYPPALDPFSADDRVASAGVPREPPFN